MRDSKTAKEFVWETIQTCVLRNSKEILNPERARGIRKSTVAGRFNREARPGFSETEPPKPSGSRNQQINESTLGQGVEAEKGFAFLHEVESFAGDHAQVFGVGAQQAFFAFVAFEEGPFFGDFCL